jgi:hypothetical protein
MTDRLSGHDLEAAMTLISALKILKVSLVLIQKSRSHRLGKYGHNAAISPM